MLVPPGTRGLEQFMNELELEGGADLNRLPVGYALEIETQNTIYILERRSDGYYIWGNRKYCPQPTKIKHIGSVLGGTAIRMDFVGREAKIEMRLSGRDNPITTSWVKSVKEAKLPSRADNNQKL